MPFASSQEAREAQCKAVEARLQDPVKELREMQVVIKNSLLGEGLKPIEAAQLLRAYVEAEKLKRVIRGQAANTSQSIRSEPVKKSKTPAAAPMEWVEPEPIEPAPGAIGQAGQVRHG